jgi:hypothetical protein
MERYLELLTSKDSKTRVEALSELCDSIVAGPELERVLPELCKLVATCVTDNNQKASAAACLAIVKLATAASVRCCCSLAVGQA